MRLFLPFSGLLAILIVPFLLASYGGWNGQRSLSVELGSALGISALAVLAILLILPSRLRTLKRLGADVAVRLHRHLVGVLMSLLVGHIALAVALQPARYGLLTFFGQPWRAPAAGPSGVCLFAPVAPSGWRQRARVPHAARRGPPGGGAPPTPPPAAGPPSGG